MQSVEMSMLWWCGYTVGLFFIILYEYTLGNTSTQLVAHALGYTVACLMAATTLLLIDYILRAHVEHVSNVEKSNKSPKTGSKYK